VKENVSRLSFGEFFGRSLGERELPGFRLAHFVPRLRKRDVAWHHHDEAHFVWVLRGHYETGALQHAGGGAPRLVYSPPGTTHRDCFADDDLSRAAFCTLSVSSSALASAETEVMLPSREICLQPSAAAVMARLLAECGDARQGTGDDLSACVAESLCLELLLRTGLDRASASSGAPAWLKRARELLRDTCLLPGPRSVRDVAAALDVHPVHLARSFRRHFGTTPGEYLRRCRLERARGMLQGSRAGLADIATAAGFSDQSHFTNAFRGRFGVSPGVFRRASGDRGSS
jgi:AraC family transcriptional regulator